MQVTELSFDRGTLVLKNATEHLLKNFSAEIRWDDRTECHRSVAFYYRDIVVFLRNNEIPYVDKAKAFRPHEMPLKEVVAPRYYQQDGLAAWQEKGSRGVVTLPTGAGKTILAVLAIAATKRPTLVHVPTIDLMHQWMAVLQKFFDVPVGLMGGGYHDIQPLTVATYDSALLHVSHKGNAFGFLVFDECHHLPGDQVQFVAAGSIAPFRLGLTATPERSDGKESVLFRLCGPLCYEAQIRDLEGKTLAPYEVCTLQVELEPSERLEYEELRKKYTDFLKREGVDFQNAAGWQNFLRRVARAPDGREVFRAYLRQKRLSQASEAKEKIIWDLISKHASERILIFTQDNEMAYRIGKKYFFPVLTHHTKVKERESMLVLFRSGTYRVLVTSKVLNEGVDVPEASVAIVVSGSGTVREHVQRLGRILRATPGKRAILYELVSAGTAEFYVNRRRRQHSAYQKSAPREDI